MVFKRIGPVLLILSLITTGCNFDKNGYPIADETGQSIGHPLPVTVNNTPSVNIYGVETDNVSEALTVIDVSHKEVHEGNMFSVCNVTDLASGANVSMLFVTPNLTKSPHIVFDVETEAEAEFKIYESSNASVNGTALTPVNHNRVSANIAATKVFLDPTITNYGTLLCIRHWGSGHGVGGGDRSTNEWILKPNTNYVIVITNFTTQANHATVIAEWYLEPD